MGQQKHTHTHIYSYHSYIMTNGDYIIVSDTLKDNGTDIQKYR